MNTWQLVRQLRYLLQQAAWQDGAQERVFGDVVVTEQPFSLASQQWRAPCALIRVSPAQADPQEPRLLLQQVEVTAVHSVPGGSAGEAVMVGGPRAGGVGSSQGRGLLELEEELLRAVGRLGGANGVRLRVVSQGMGELLADEAHGYLAARGFLLEGWVGAARAYPAPVNLVATGGSGEVALTWRVPATRFDLLNVVLRRSSGSTPPSSPTDGTGVTLASSLATSVTDAGLSAGTYSYALFAGYDETSETPTSADRYSSALTRAGVVVT